MLSPPPESGCSRTSPLWAWGGHCLTFSSKGSLRGPKENQAPCFRALWSPGLPHFIFSFVVTEQAVLVGAKTGMVTLEPHWPAVAPGSAPLPSPFSEGVRAGDPRLPGRSALECGARSTGQARVTAGLHLAMDPPHLSAPPPGWACRLAARARGPFIMYMRAPRLRKGPLQTLSHQ